MIKSEVLKPRLVIPQTEMPCLPFQMTYRQHYILEQTANGKTLKEIGKNLNVQFATVNDQRMSLSYFETPKQHHQNTPLFDTGLIALIQDGINEGYIKLDIARPTRKIVLSPNEEVLINSIASGESIANLSERTGLSPITLGKRKTKLRKRLRARNTYHALANYTWLKNRGLISPENEEISPHKLLSNAQLQVLQMYADGLSRTEIADKLGILPKSVHAYTYSMSFIGASKNNIHPTTAAVALIQDGVNYGYIKSPNTDRQIVKLKPHELEYIDLICQGLEGSEIRGKMGVGKRKLATTREIVLRKLKAKTLYHAVARYTALKNCDLIGAI